MWHAVLSTVNLIRFSFLGAHRTCRCKKSGEHLDLKSYRTRVPQMAEFECFRFPDTLCDGGTPCDIEVFGAFCVRVSGRAEREMSVECLRSA